MSLTSSRLQRQCNSRIKCQFSLQSSYESLCIRPSPEKVPWSVCCNTLQKSSIPSLFLHLLAFFSRFNKIAIQATAQMAADKEAISLSRVHMYESNCMLPLQDNRLLTHTISRQLILFHSFTVLSTFLLYVSLGRPHYNFQQSLIPKIKLDG